MVWNGGQLTPQNLTPCTEWALSKYLGQTASQGGASQAQKNEGITRRDHRSGASEHVPCLIHIPDKIGTEDSGADPTVGEKEAVSVHQATPS